MRELHLPKVVNRIVKQQVQLRTIRGNKALAVTILRERRTGIQYHAQAQLNAPETMLGWNARQRAKHCLVRVSDL